MPLCASPVGYPIHDDREAFLGERMSALEAGVGKCLWRVSAAVRRSGRVGNRRSVERVLVVRC